MPSDENPIFRPFRERKKNNKSTWMMADAGVTKSIGRMSFTRAHTKRKQKVTFENSKKRRETS
jgi:hypothetical protein